MLVYTIVCCAEHLDCMLNELWRQNVAAIAVDLNVDLSKSRTPSLDRNQANEGDISKMQNILQEKKFFFIITLLSFKMLSRFYTINVY